MNRLPALVLIGMKLRQLLYLLLLSLVFVGCNSGSDKKSDSKKLPIIRPAEIQLTMEDTTEVMNLVNQFMTLYQNQDLQSAAQMLYTVENGQPQPYTDDSSKEFINHFPFTKIFDYKVNGFTIRSEKDNEVTVKIQFDPSGDIASNKGVINFVLNPVKLNNHWYLTLMNLRAEGVRRDI